MKKPDYETCTIFEVINYANYQENCLNGASDLIIELNLTSKVFATDLRMIREGDSDTTYIGKADKTKKFEHAMTLFDKIDKIKALSSYFKGEEKEKTTGNPFEDTSKKIQAKLNGGAK